MRWLKAAAFLKNKQTESLSHVCGRTEGWMCCVLDEPCGSWGQLPPQPQQDRVVPGQFTSGSSPVPVCREPLLEVCAQSWVSSLQTAFTIDKKITMHITYCSFYVSGLCFPAQTGCPSGRRAIGGQNHPLGASGCIPCSHNLSLLLLLSSP